MTLFRNWGFRMQCYIVLCVLFYIHLTNNVEARSKKSKSVTTLLEAKWEVTPLVLEVSEYLADENVDYYWSFIDSISTLSPSLVEIGMDALKLTDLISQLLCFR